MKVVKGPFGEAEPTKHAGERLLEQLAMTGLDQEAHGTYVLLFDVGDSTMVVTNTHSAAEVLLEIEKGKWAVMAQEMTGE